MTTEATYIGVDTWNYGIGQLTQQNIAAYAMVNVTSATTGGNGVNLDENTLNLTGSTGLSFKAQAFTDNSLTVVESTSIQGDTGNGAALITDGKALFASGDTGVQVTGVSDSTPATITIKGFTPSATNKYVTVLLGRTSTFNDAGGEDVDVCLFDATGDNIVGKTSGGFYSYKLVLHQSATKTVGLYQYTIEIENEDYSNVGSVRFDIRSPYVNVQGVLLSSSDVVVYRLPCFLKDTEILTPNGIKMIQDIENGDDIITKDGKVTEVLFAGSRSTWIRNKHTEPYVIEKDTFGENIPSKDTFCSGEHKIFVPKLGYVETRQLAKRYEGIHYSGKKAPYTYYTLVVDNDESYFANNMPVESLPKENKKLYDFNSKLSSEMNEIEKKYN